MKILERGAAEPAREERAAQAAGGRGPLRQHSMTQTWFALGCGLMLLGVIAGAFAAHGLKAHLSADDLDIWQTGARYHMYHALALFAVAYATNRWSSSLTTVAGWLFVAGIVLFAGSLYILALSGVKWLGAITPLGGACFIFGWASLGLAALRG